MTLWNRQRALWKNPNVAYLPLATLAVRGGRASCPMPVIGIRRRLSPAGRGSKRRANDLVRLVPGSILPVFNTFAGFSQPVAEAAKKVCFSDRRSCEFHRKRGCPDGHVRDPNRRKNPPCEKSPSPQAPPQSCCHRRHSRNSRVKVPRRSQISLGYGPTLLFPMSSPR